MRGVTRAGWPAAVVVVLAAALVAGCTHASSDGSRAADANRPGAVHSAQVTAGKPTTVTADGITVTIPAGAAPAGATLRLSTRTPDPASLPPQLIPAGRAAVAEVDGGTLTAAATVTFPTPAGANGTDVVPVVVWQDGAGGWRWLPSAWTPGSTTITATTDHFSFGFPATVDVKKWIADRGAALTDYLTGRSGVAQPTCGDEKAARADGIRVTSDGGDSIKWCFGTQNGRRILKIANNRRTYTEIDYPKTWQVANPPSLSFTPETLSRALGTAAALVPAGDAARVIDGGDTLTLVVPAGRGGHVLAAISSESFLIDALYFGVNTYALVWKLGASQFDATTSWERIADYLAGLSDKGDGYHKAFKECSLASVDLAGPVSHAGPDLLKYAWHCVPALMQADIVATGIKMFAIGVVLSVVAGIVSAILDGVHLLVVGIRELWDDLASIGGKSDPSYDISLGYPPATLSLSGFGPIHWGESQADAEAMLGTHFQLLEMGNGCQQATLAGVPGLVFGIQDGRVVVGAVLGGAGAKTPVTDTGLHVGDAVSQALKAYPKLTIGADSSDAYSTRLEYISGGREVQLISMDPGDVLAPPNAATLARQTIDAMQFGLSTAVGEAPCV